MASKLEKRKVSKSKKKDVSKTPLLFLKFSNVLRASLFYWCCIRFYKSPRAKVKDLKFVSLD